MPGGGGKGPSSSGNITQTTVNPTQQAQLPFLVGARDNAGGGWNRAAYLADSSPISYYPGQTRANDNGLIGQGYQRLADTAIWNGDNTVNAGNAAFNSATTGGYGVGNSPAFSGYNDIAGGNTRGQIAALGAAESLPVIGQQAGDEGRYWGNRFQELAGRGNVNDGQVRALNGLSNQATENPYMNQLANFGLYSQINGLDQAQGLLRTAGSDAGAPNIATRTLANEAGGAFLNRNPYIDRQYQAAADPVVRNYMSATAPQTESNYELAGRYGSGVLGNARSQNEQNLGKSLGDLGANLYGQDYANERGLMQQAQGTLGSLINQGVGLRTAAGSALGNLGLGEFGARGGMLGQAGNQYLSGVQTAIGGHTAAGNLAQSDYNNTLGATRSAYDAIMGGLQQKQNAYVSGGNLGLGYAGSMLPALNGLQSGYEAGNTASLRGLALEPSVLNSGYNAANALTQAGQGFTGLDQSKITDQMARFYGEQNAPWDTATRYANLVGQPTTGSSQITTPLLGPSPLSSGLGAIGGLNSAFGNGGALSGLFGGGSGLGQAGVFAGDSFLGSSLAGIPEATLDAAALAGGIGGGGGGGLLSFLGGIGSLFSDRRLKTDIEQVGELDNGLSVYSYKMRGSDTPQIGLMADEVQKLHPEAVTKHPSGYRMVNYGLAVQPNGLASTGRRA